MPCDARLGRVLHFGAVDNQISQPNSDRHQPQQRKAGGHPLPRTVIVLYLAYLLLASAEVFHPYEKIASYYGFKAVASRQGARFYVHGKYLLGVLDNGRWGMSDRTLEPQRGGRLVAEGTSIISLEAWLKQNRL